MVHLEEAASLVEEADEAQHRMALVQGQLGDTCCGGYISDAFLMKGLFIIVLISYYHPVLKFHALNLSISS